MSELQLSGLLFILIGALPTYLLTNYIEKGKHWTLFSGWDPSKIRDQDAYGAMLCKGVRTFSFSIRCHGNTHDARRRRQRTAHPHGYLSLSRTVVLLHA